MRKEEEKLLPHYNKMVEYQSSINDKNISNILNKLGIHEQPCNSLLDLGCGDGRLCRFVAEHLKIRCVGVDFSEERIKKARSFGVEKCNFLQNDLYDFLDKDDNAFDIIAFFEVLEHLLEPKLVLEKAKTKLNPGGRIIGSIPINSTYPTHLQVFSLTRFLEKFKPSYHFGNNILYVKWNA